MGLDGLMLACVTCGFSPVTSLMEATQQVRVKFFLNELTFNTNFAFRFNKLSNVLGDYVDKK